MVMGINKYCRCLYTKTCIKKCIHKILGWCSQAQGAMDTEIGEKVEDDERHEEDKRISKCTICLSTSEHPTATRCGHVFCWYYANAQPLHHVVMYSNGATVIVEDSRVTFRVCSAPHLALCTRSTKSRLQTKTSVGNPSEDSETF